MLPTAVERMASDTALAVAVLVLSLGSAYLFVRWDIWTEKRHQAKLDAEIVEIVRKRSDG